MPLPAPPHVPRSLRDRLKDHPDCVARLQNALNRYVGDPSRQDLFKGAIRELQRTLQALSAESSNELAAAKAAGDQAAIDITSRKYYELYTAGWLVFEMVDMDDLWDYFRTNKDAFR